MLVSKTGQDLFPSPIGQQITLDDPSLSLDSLDKRIAYLQTYIDMALSDGILTNDEKEYILDMGSKLQIPKKEIEKVLNDEIKKCSVKTGVLSGQGTPRLEIDKTSFEIPKMQHGSTAARTFTINNSGGGILSGLIKTNKKWLKVSQSNIDTTRHRQEISFQVDTTGLDYGFKDTGTIDIQSNAGTERVAVNISIEEDEAAISRFRHGLTWAGLIVGGLFGAFIYSVLDPISGEEVTALAMLVSLISIVIVAVKIAYQQGENFFGWGFGTLIGGCIILGILSYFPHALSTVAWTLLYGSFAYLVSKPIRKALWKGDQNIPIIAGAVALALTVGIIIGGIESAAPRKEKKLAQEKAGEKLKQKFEDNGNGTVSDNDTKLMWQQGENDKEMTWKSAITYCKNLPLAGYNDWRLPSIDELKSIIDLKEKPTINKMYFPNVNSSLYWSSTTNASGSSYAWHVYFHYGYVYYYPKSITTMCDAFVVDSESVIW